MARYSTRRSGPGRGCALLIVLALAGAFALGYYVRGYVDAPASARLPGVLPAAGGTVTPGPSVSGRAPVATSAAGAAPIANSSPTALLPDWAIADGHFYTQGTGGAGRGGFAVLDTPEAKFWTTYQRLGGPATLGYPLSRPFAWEGGQAQLFQRGLLHALNGQVQPANLLDLLSQAGYDQRLKERWRIPEPLPPRFDAGLSWNEVMAKRLRLLDAQPEIKAAYYGVPDPLAIFGLPASQVETNGTGVVLRLQRGVIVYEQATNTTTVLDVGQIAADLDYFPKVALQPSSGGAPPARAPTSTPATTARVVVANTGGEGVYLQPAPQIRERLIAWPDGTRLVVLAERDVAGEQWLEVRDPRGTVGWLPERYTRPGP